MGTGLAAHAGEAVLEVPAGKELVGQPRGSPAASRRTCERIAPRKWRGGR
jgi:hypothetical protein